MALKPTFANEHELDQFLAVPAPGAMELHVTDSTRQRRGFFESLATDVLEDIALAAIGAGGETTSETDTIKMLELSWVGPNGPVSTVITKRFSLTHEKVIQRARSLRVGVRYIEYNETNLSKTYQSGSLFCARHPARLGKLQKEAQIVDDPQLFDASISRLDQPGLLARKVRRKSPEQVYFRVRQDSARTWVEHKMRDGHFMFETPNADFLGIAMPRLKPLAVTINGTVELPTMGDWHRADYRGRDFAVWAYDRVLTRLGM